MLRPWRGRHLRSEGPSRFLIGSENLLDEWLPAEPEQAATNQPHPSLREEGERSGRPGIVSAEPAGGRRVGEPGRRAAPSGSMLGRVAALILAIGWIALGVTVVGGGGRPVEPAGREAASSLPRARGRPRPQPHEAAHRTRPRVKRPGRSPQPQQADPPNRSPAPALQTPEPAASVTEVQPAVPPPVAPAASEPSPAPPLRPGEALQKEFGP